VDDLVISDRIDGHSLLCQAKEELAATLGSSAIEPERELIQIVIQVLMTDRSLVGSHQPPFEQGDHLVNPCINSEGVFFFPVKNVTSRS
jgi:hypothetical protein